MYSKFENLTEEKRKKIIEACIEEFSQHGYKNASTNNIVKKAEISKGILFHYFGNKKRLYLYVLDHVIDFLTEIMYSRFNDLPVDFFERIIEVGMVKLKVAYEYPVEYKFLLDAIMHTTDDVRQDVQERYEKIYQKSMPMMFDNIDTSKFRDEIDRNKAMEVISFALEGLSNKYIKLFQSKQIDEIMSQMEKLSQEFYEYTDILKKGVY